MEFCSKYGYDYGFSGSSEDEYEEENEFSKIKIHKRIRKSDSNIVALKMDQLVNPNESFAGEPKMCKKCTAVMSHLSVDNINRNRKSKMIWTCEFCSEENDITIMLDYLNELPTEDDVTYLIDVPENSKIEAASKIDFKKFSNDDKYMTFALDVSTSMQLEINEQENINQKTLQRLEGVKIACIEALNNLRENEPNKRVSLVTFSDNVIHYGDCTNLFHNEIQIFNDNNLAYSTDELADKYLIVQQAENSDGNLKNISESYNDVVSRILQLKPRGCTALGPALLFSIVFSSKLPGSSVLLCTDGCANVGMGSMEDVSDDVARQFYDELADFAKLKGVSVNIISVEGADCKLAILGRVADRTNGTLSIVNPLNLDREFSSILKSRVVATNVEVKLIVNHKYLYVRDELLEAEEAEAIDKGDTALKEKLIEMRKSVLCKNIGNANIDTEVTFEYGVRCFKEFSQKQVKFNNLPFQLQVSYTAQDGSKALRVYTKVQEFTKQRSLAEMSLTSEDLYCVNASQKASYHVLGSHVSAAKYRAFSQREFLKRNHIKASKNYSVIENTIMRMSKDFLPSKMSDSDARNFYAMAKTSRSKSFDPDKEFKATIDKSILKSTYRPSIDSMNNEPIQAVYAGTQHFPKFERNVKPQPVKQAKKLASRFSKFFSIFSRKSKS